MGRTAHCPPADLIRAEDAIQILPEALAADRQMAALESAYGAERDLLNQIIGRVQTSRAMAEFSLTVGVSQMAKVRENKLYKAMRGMETADGRRFSGTWDEFCEFIGSSRQKADEDIQNLHSFGETALDSMRSVGIGYREMRDFRRLPQDERAALVQIAEAGDKDGLMELAEALIARQVREKDAMRLREQDLREAIESKDRLLAEKGRKIDDLATQLDKKSQGSLLVQVAVADPDEQGRQLREELHARAAHVEVSIRGNLHLAIQAALEHAEATGGSVRDLIAGYLGQIATAVDELRGLYAIPLAPEGRAPGVAMVERWAREDARTAEEVAADRRAKADEYVRGMRDGGKTDEVIQRMHPAIWAESSFATHPDHLDS